ncbi:MAG: hypothetical protein JWM40_2108 [Frankiales bacterium]|nr:hypothetical protein [Frankiales bacterium]
MRSPRVALGDPRAAAASVLGAFLVYQFLVREPRTLTTQLIALFLALLILPLIARRPTASLCVLLVLLPFQLITFSWLLKHGVPASLLRHLGAAKDLLLAGLLLRGVQDWLALRRSRLARLDIWLLLYVGLVTAYLVAPIALPALTPIPLSQRLTAWRLDVFFLVLFVALRWMRPGSIDTRAVRATVLGAGAVVAAGCAWEYFDSSGWSNFLYKTLGVQQYTAVVLNNPILPGSFLHTTADGSVRAGSVLLEPVFAAFYLLPPFFLAVTVIASKRSVLGSLLAGLLGLGLICTSTRSALLVGLLGAAYITLRVLRSGTRYVKVFVPVLVIAIALSPGLVAQTSLVSRISQAVSGQDTSTQGHSNDLSLGFQRAVDEPLGTGLGSGAGVGQRFEVHNQATTENAYLQVVVETGAIALLMFLGILLLITRGLITLPASTASAKRDRTGALALMMAMALGGLLQTVWLSFSVSVTAIVVLALPHLTPAEAEAGDDDELSEASGPHPEPPPAARPPRAAGPAGSRAAHTHPAARQTSARDPAARGR